MRNPVDPRGWANSLLEIAMLLLGAAVALYVAAELIRSVAPVLIVALLITAVCWIVLFLTKRRNDDSQW